MLLKATEWIEVHFNEMGKICGGADLEEGISYKFSFIMFDKCLSDNLVKILQGS